MSDAPIKVLVVDDEKIIRNSLEFFLEDEGFEVNTADTGEGALRILDNEDMDVGIFDMRMPDIDGNTLIMKIHVKCPSLKFIIYTGSSDYVLPGVMTDIGITMDEVFIKPLTDMGLLVDTLLRLGKKD
ncbi:MAG: response regulator [bacterium]|nr:response regulator [bacterium]